MLKEIAVALKPCPECGQNVSTDAKKCPHCGKDLSSDLEQFSKGCQSLGCLLLLLSGLGFFFLFIVPALY